jgi:acyl-CoA thioesterase FadM
MDSTSELKMRVWPSDIDIYPEMNNGRHLTLMDLGRLDLAGRTGLMRVAHRKDWGFVVAGSSIRYRHKLPPWHRFTLCTKIIGYDEKWFYFLQETKQNGKICSSALIRAALKKTDGLVPVKEVLKAMNEKTWKPTLPDWVCAWKDADDLRPHL